MMGDALENDEGVPTGWGLEMALFSTVWVWAAFFVAYGTGWVVAEGSRLVWPTVPGIIAADGRSYSYAVGGREFTAKDYSSASPGNARLPEPGSPVAVHYNPLRPTQAYLEPELPPLTTLRVLLMAGFVLGVGAGVVLLRGPIHLNGVSTVYAAFAFAASLVGPALLALLFGGGLMVILGLSARSPDLMGDGLAGAAGALAGLGVLMGLGPYPLLRAWAELFESEEEEPA